MARRERRKFSDEYKAEVVALVRSSGKSIGEISRDLDLTETAVREWVQHADVEGGQAHRPRSTAECEELSRLRRQVRVLRGGTLDSEKGLVKRCQQRGPRASTPGRATTELGLMTAVSQGRVALSGPRNIRS